MQPRKVQRNSYVAIMQKYYNKKVAIKIREYCEKTMFTPSNQMKATNPIVAA
jgi:hypothetical protein